MVAGVVPGREREPQVGECGAGSRAVEHRDADRGPARHTRFAEQQLRGEQHRVHAAQQRDVGRRRAGVEPRGDPLDCGVRDAFRRSGHDGQRVGARVDRLGRDDLLVDASPVVREEVAGRGDDRFRAAVVRRQRVVRTAGEVAVVVDQELGVGARVAVDHLIVVADAEHVVRGRGDEAEQQQLRGREVLELVDEKMARLALERGAHVGCAQQRFDRAVDLLVVIDRSIGVQLVAVLLEHRPEAGDVVALGFDHVRVDESQPDLAQRVDVGRVHVGVRARLDRYECLDATAHLPLVDEGGVAAAAAQHVVAERVQRAHAPPRGVVHVGQTRLHRVLGADVVRDRGDRAGTPTPVDQEPEPFGEHARLARARGRDHACRAGVVDHGRELIGGELGGGGDGPVGGEDPLFEVVAVDEHVTVRHRRWRRRAVHRRTTRAWTRRAPRRHRCPRSRPTAPPPPSGPTPCGRRGGRSCWRGRGSRAARA